MKRATTDPWMTAADYGRGLRGLGVNLLVRDIDAALPFHRAVLDAEVVHADPDFAVLRRDGAEWMLHADHTYRDHPLHGSLSEELPRGIGADIRLYGRDPDAAEAAAIEAKADDSASTEAGPSEAETDEEKVAEAASTES